MEEVTEATESNKQKKAALGKQAPTAMETEAVITNDLTKDTAVGELEPMEIDGGTVQVDKPALNIERLPIDNLIPDDDPLSTVASAAGGEPTNILSRRNRLPTVVTEDAQEKEYGCDVGWLDKILG
ncbi:unnamed protein product [Arabis nemorensis]|uniref:Uncharacterized protein n=1 Tax=Arabis nemorensis TaxID=586526 RepID=A0A565BEM9_9BRAS|nr:unnamed protein product [Arabis nemorensis]